MISDYGKGVCTLSLLRAVIDAARDSNIPVLIDPARIADYTGYRGATLLKPNRAETEMATGRSFAHPDEMISAVDELRHRLGLEAILVTLDSEGMLLFEGSHAGQPSQEIPARPRAVCDITGAGDTVLAVLGLCIASKASLPQAAQIANTAAGLQVERFGVTQITREELQAALIRQSPIQGEQDSTASPNSSFILPPSSFHSKLTTLPALTPLTKTYRHQRKTTVFTNGCFDLLHVGHVTYLHEAAALGDILIVAINSDASVRRLKGPDRPVINQHDRALMLASLGCVHHVLIFDEDTPHHLLEQLRPDILVKGGTTAEIVGQELVESYGGTVRRLGQVDGISTTNLVSRIQSTPLSQKPSVQFAPIRVGGEVLSPEFSQEEFSPRPTGHPRAAPTAPP